MSTEENKQVARRMTDEVWNLGKLDVLDEICAPNYQLRGTGGIAELRQSVAVLRRAFPDLWFTIEELIAECDAVASRWSLRCTHLGEFEGIAPTGKVLDETGITIFHFAGGKIVDDRFESSIPDVRQLLLAAG
jgi:predicted ester cyclase